MRQLEQITGLGPVNTVDGSRDIFITNAKQPFHATKEWLEQYAEPEMGDYLETLADGSVQLVAEAEVSAERVKLAAENAPATNPQVNAGETAEPAAQKKTDGPEHGTGSVHAAPASSQPSANSGKPSGLKFYKARPIVAAAGAITHVDQPGSDGSVAVTLEDGSIKSASPAMLARIQPQVGDYWVIQEQEDGIYEYLNPKDVFERKYELVQE